MREAKKKFLMTLGLEKSDSSSIFSVSNLQDYNNYLCI